MPEASSSSGSEKPQLGNEVGATIRRFRRQAGLSTRELARRIGVAESYVSKVELGQRTPRPGFCENAARALNLSRFDRELLRTLLALHHSEHRSTVFGPDGMRAGQLAIRRLEREAHSFKVFQLSLIPGLLQTPNYVMAIFRRIGVTSHMKATVDERVARQDVLNDHRRSFQFLVADWALGPHWCSGRVMAEQLRHLKDLARRPNVDIRVLRHDSHFPAQIMPLSLGFQVIDDAIVIADTLTGFTTFRHPDEVEEYVRAFIEASSAGERFGQ